MKDLKFDYKKTIYVGLAFFLIQMFWQTYDNLVAKILIDKFGLNQTWSGLIMALDNILALVMLPIFGLLSDRTKSKMGKRTPYILIGTLIAAFAFASISIVDNNQTKLVKEQGIVLEYEATLPTINAKGEADIVAWDAIFNDIKEQGYTVSFDAYENVKKDTSITSKFLNREIADVYYNYLSIKAMEVTKANNYTNLIWFIGLLLVVLIAMSVFRSPAVALMPDVTLKHNRSKANAIINLLGAAAAMLAILILAVFGLSNLSYVNYAPAFITNSIIMVLVLGIFLWKVKEPKLLEEYNLLEKEYELLNSNDVVEEVVEVKGKLTKEEKISLLLILMSVFLWYMGYNAVTTKLSDYAPKQLNMGFSLPLLVAQGAAIISFIPIGMLSSKFGRKKMILFGVLLLTVSFGSAFFLTAETGVLLYVVLALTGIAWATINVNSFPMAVELASGEDIGKYTGYYYAFSMAAQIITPILSGIVMDSKLGRPALFPYATIFVALSFVTMFFVKHGDAKVEKRGLLESFDAED